MSSMECEIENNNKFHLQKLISVFMQTISIVSNNKYGCYVVCLFIHL